MFDALTDEELEVIFTALDFLEDKYLHPRMQRIRDELLEEVIKEQGR